MKIQELEKSFKEEISRDKLFLEIVKLDNVKKIKIGRKPINSSDILSGKVFVGIGSYTSIPSYYLEVVETVLDNYSSLKLALYFIRNIIGKTFNKKGNHKTCIKYENRKITRECNLSRCGFDNGMSNLLEKGLIFYEDGYIHLNIFPLTWNIDDERTKEKITVIVEKEIERIKKTILKHQRNTDTDDGNIINLQTFTNAF